MASEPTDNKSASDAAKTDRGLSRRAVLTGVGAVAASVGLGTTETAAAPAPPSDDKHVGVAPDGVTIGEFRSRIMQSGPTGETFVSFGYVLRLAGLSDDDLFANAAHNETTALLTAYSEGALVQRVHDGDLHVIDVQGVMTIYQRVTPGATFAVPASFQEGTPVARFDFTLQDVLSVFAPGRGMPTMTGDLLQTEAGPLAGTHKRFGRVGTRSRLFATGLGTLVDAATLNSVHDIAGNWTTA